MNPRLGVARKPVDASGQLGRVGLSVIVAVSAPSALAVRTCDAAGITLIAIARQDGFEVFTSSHRVTGDGVANAPRLARNGKIARRQE